MMHKVALGALAMLAVAAAAHADGLDPIVMRKVGMDLTGGDYAFVKSVATAKGDLKQIEYPAQALETWGKLIPSLFPPGSDKGHDTKALPEVWSDRAGFEKSAAEFTDASTKLVAAVKARDADAVIAETKAVGEACGACHRHYRAK